MYAKLMQFAADGGGDAPEAVNQALDDAINQDVVEPGPEHVQSRVPGRRRAAAHGLPGRREVSRDVAAAAAKGIVVNTIQCGSMRETVAPWQQIASLGHGRYFTVEQAGSAVAITTPFDDEDRDALGRARLDTRCTTAPTRRTRRWPRKLERRARAARVRVGRGAGAARRVQRERGRRVRICSASRSSSHDVASGARRPSRPCPRPRCRRRSSGCRATSRRPRSRRLRRSARSCSIRSRELAEGSRRVHQEGGRRARRRDRTRSISRSTTRSASRRRRSGSNTRAVRSSERDSLRRLTQRPSGRCFF